MSLLPQILSLSDRKVLIFGSSQEEVVQAARAFQAGTHDTHTFFIVDVVSGLPPSLQCLEIHLGSDFDEETLISSLRHVKNHCLRLKSISFILHVKACTQCFDIIIRELPIPLLHVDVNIFDPDLGYELLLTGPFGAQVDLTILARFPLDVIEASILHDLSILPNLQEMVLSPPISLIQFSRRRNEIVEAFVGGIRACDQLRKVSLPLHFASDLRPLLFAISTLPHLHALKLSPPASHAFFAGVREEVVSALTAGIYGFDHLREVTLPVGTLCNPLIDCLAALPDLRVLKLSSATSQARIPCRPASSVGQFPSLRRLQVSGSMSDLADVILACVHVETSMLRTVSIFAESLQHETEMPEAIRVVVTHCRKLRNLVVHVRNVHPAESIEWMNLDPHIRECLTLRTLTISHPLPLPLTDLQVQLMLRSWPLVTHISLNPRPSMGLARIHSETHSYPPTLKCLDYLARYGGQRLCHFGVYLNSLVEDESIDQELPLLTLAELDLGTSNVSMRTTASIRCMFPNATVT